MMDLSNGLAECKLRMQNFIVRLYDGKFRCKGATHIDQTPSMGKVR